MDQLSEATLSALIRNWMLWVGVFGLLYLFSLYVYFFPTPLTQPFVSGGSRGPQPKNAHTR